MTSLFGDDYTLTLTDDEWRVFTRDVNGDGGAQQLLRQLQACQHGVQQLTVDYASLDRAYRCAYRYASGGFQDRFRVIVRAALRAGWSPYGSEGISAGTRAPFGRQRRR